MEFELDGRQHLSPSYEDNHHHNQELPPVDGGKDAWLFLAACFLIEALIWGISPFMILDTGLY